LVVVVIIIIILFIFYRKLDGVIFVGWLFVTGERWVLTGKSNFNSNV